MVDQTKIKRDNSGAVVSMEASALQEYKNRKKIQRQANERVENLERRVEALEKLLLGTPTK